jgi:hypothetical protein
MIPKSEVCDRSSTWFGRYCVVNVYLSSVVYIFCVTIQGKKEKVLSMFYKTSLLLECIFSLLGHPQEYKCSYCSNCTPEDDLISRKCTRVINLFCKTYLVLFSFFPYIEDVSPGTFTIIFKSYCVTIYIHSSKSSYFLMYHYINVIIYIELLYVCYVNILYNCKLMFNLLHSNRYGTLL